MFTSNLPPSETGLHQISNLICLGDIVELSLAQNQVRFLSELTVTFRFIFVGNKCFVELIIFGLVSSCHVLMHSLQTKLPIHDSRFRILVNEDKIYNSCYRYHASRV